MKPYKPLFTLLLIALVALGVVTFVIRKVRAADQVPTLNPQQQVDLLGLQLEYQKMLPQAQAASQAAFQNVMKPIDDRYNTLTKGWCESKGKEQYKIFIPPPGQGNPQCLTQVQIDNFGKAPAKK